MSDEHDRTDGPRRPPPPSVVARQARLAVALRSNLAKRRQQARARDAAEIAEDKADPPRG